MRETPDAAVTDDLRRRNVPTGLIMVGMAAIAWWPAFSLGVWGEIFFDDILALWAASVAALVFVLGVNQARFLTCEDFTISGNAAPDGCAPADRL